MKKTLLNKLGTKIGLGLSSLALFAMVAAGCSEDRRFAINSKKERPLSVEQIKLEPRNPMTGEGVKLKGKIVGYSPDKLKFAWIDEDLKTDSRRKNLEEADSSNADYIIFNNNPQARKDNRAILNADGSFEVDMIYNHPSEKIIHVGVVDNKNNVSTRDISVKINPYQNPNPQQDDDDDDNDDSTQTCTFNDRCVGTGFVDWNNNRVEDSAELSCDSPEPGAVYVNGICGAECSTDINCNDNNGLTRDECIAGMCSNTPIGNCSNDLQCNDGNPLTLDECINNNCVNNLIYQCDDNLDCNQNTCNQTYNEDCTSPTGLTRTYLGDMNGNRIQDSVDIVDSCQNSCEINSGDDAGMCRTDCVVDCSFSGIVDYSCVIGVCGAECSNDLDCDDSNINTLDTCNDCTCTNQFTGQCQTNEECNDGNPLTVDSCDIPNAQCRNILTYECFDNSSCIDNFCGPAVWTDYCNGFATIDYNGNRTLDDLVLSDSCDNTCAFDFPNGVTDAGYCTDCDPSALCAEPIVNAQCIPGNCGAECALDSDCNDSNPLTDDSCSLGCLCTNTFNGECQSNIDCNDNNPLTEDVCNLETAQCEYTPALIDEASARDAVYTAYTNYFDNVISGRTSDSWIDLFGFGIIPEDDEYNVFRNNDSSEPGSAITAGYNFKGYPNASTNVPDFSQANTDAVNIYNSFVETNGGYAPVTVREINASNPKLQTYEGILDCTTADINYHLSEGVVDTREEDCE